MGQRLHLCGPKRSEHPAARFLREWHCLWSRGPGFVGPEIPRIVECSRSRLKGPYPVCLAIGRADGLLNHLPAPASLPVWLSVVGSVFASASLSSPWHGQSAIRFYQKTV